MYDNESMMTMTIIKIEIVQFFTYFIGGRFSKFDYGVTENLKRYGQTSPPVYDVSKMKVFTALYYSNADVFAPSRVLKSIS